MTGKILKVGAAICLAVLVLAGTANAFESRDKADKSDRMQILRQNGVLDRWEHFRQNGLNAQYRIIKDLGPDRGWRPDMLHPSAVENAYSIVDDRPRMGSGNSLLDLDTLAPDPLPAHIANTSYDSQANDSQGHQIARNPGADFVHMVWIHWDVIPVDIADADRFVNYAAWDVLAAPGFELIPGFDGVSIGLGDFARAGFVRMDIDSDNKAHTVFHQYPDVGEDQSYSAWHVFLPVEGDVILSPEQLPLIPANPEVTETLWPDMAITQNNGVAKDNTTDLYHVIGMGAIPAGPGFASPSGDLAYWRWDQANPGWNAPVIIDSTNGALSYVIDACDGTDKVAAVFTQNYESQWNNLFNVVYRESVTGGLGWVNTAELGDINRKYVTDYSDNITPGPQTWGHISVLYDHDNVLHVFWDEQRQANLSDDIAIRHWDDASLDIRPVALGYYTNDANYSGHLNLNKLTAGVGDGSATCDGDPNTNYLYVTYTKNCGESVAEAEDFSKFGICNGEIYITGSRDDGNSWSPGLNITNTKTPQCTSSNPDSVCASEVQATIARDISGSEGIDIIYLQDLEAATWADGSGWTINRVMYLNLPGGNDADYVCPLSSPNFAAFITSDDDCEYHAAPNTQNHEDLTILNIGNATMNGNISVQNDPSGFLSVADSGAYSIAVGAPDLVADVEMDATGLTPGLYNAEVRVSHNDETKPDTVRIFEVAFFVANSFFCPEEEILRTNVTSPGVLWMEVESSGRYAAAAQGGLLRIKDSSYVFEEGSLVVAHGTQNPDTVAFHRFFNRFPEDPGQRGYRALSDLAFDTTAYTSGAGQVTATALMCTKDSLVGVDAKWFFPQHADSANFVIVQYTVRNRTNQLPGGHPNFNQTLNNILVGLWNDIDVVESNKQNVQQGSDNTGSDALLDSNFVYQYGFDTVGHADVVTSKKFSGGIAYLKGRDATGASFNFTAPVPIRAGVKFNVINQTQGGPTSEILYAQLDGGAGVTIDPNWGIADSTEDMFTYFQLDHGLTLAPGASQSYVVGIVSDTLSHPDYIPAGQDGAVTSLHLTLQKAWTWAEERLGCNCPGWPDPAGNGTVVNVFDVVKAVDVAFRNGTDVPVAGGACPVSHTNVDCAGVTNVFDVVKFVDVAFRNGNPATVFCTPCP